MNPPLWIAIALGVAGIAGATGRGIRKAYKAILFIKDLMQVVHERSSELQTDHGHSMYDRIQAIDRWRSSVDSTLANHGKRLDAQEKRPPRRKGA